MRLRVARFLRVRLHLPESAFNIAQLERERCILWDTQRSAATKCLPDNDNVPSDHASITVKKSNSRSGPFLKNLRQQPKY
jgi:hypothetical protein